MMTEQHRVAAEWHGTPGEGELLETALRRNCTCTVTDCGVRTSLCSAHAMVLDQVIIDKLLFMRRISYRLLTQEFVGVNAP